MVVCDRCGKKEEKIEDATNWTQLRVFIEEHKWAFEPYSMSMPCKSYSGFFCPDCIEAAKTKLQEAILQCPTLE